MNRRTLIVAGAVLLLLNGLLYITAETLTAHAWKNPTYDYRDHFISDLGTHICGEFRGRPLCSPLHRLMNIAFVTLGVVLLLAILFLTRLLGRKGRLLVVFAALFAIGMGGVGLVQSSGESVANGTVVIHIVGACLAIITGNVLAIVAGIRARRAGAPHWYRVTSIVLGAIGLAGFTGVAVTEGADFGAVLERVAVYAILIWWLITSLSVLVGARDNARIIQGADREGLR